jgi:hypothetical protein
VFPTERYFCERRLLVPLHCDFLLLTMITKFSFLETFVRALTPRIVYRQEDDIKVGLKKGMII